MTLPSEAQSLSANQISSRCLHWRLRYNYFRFRNTNVRHIGILLLISLSNSSPQSSCHSASGYRISCKSEHPLRKYDVISISQHGGRDRQYYFRFRICWCHCLQHVKVYQQTKFRRDISIGGWDITTSDFEIQTSAMLEFYFRLRSRPVRHNLHVILYQATEFRPYRSSRCGNMTSYPVINMAAATLRRSMSISMPNFVKIAQLAAEM